jgi:hypothetical protein
LTPDLARAAIAETKAQWWQTQIPSYLQWSTDVGAIEMTYTTSVIGNRLQRVNLLQAAGVKYALDVGNAIKEYEDSSAATDEEFATAVINNHGAAALKRMLATRDQALDLAAAELQKQLTGNEGQYNNSVSSINSAYQQKLNTAQSDLDSALKTATEQKNSKNALATKTKESKIAAAEEEYAQTEATLDAQYGTESAGGDTGSEGATRRAAIATRDAQYYAARDTSWANTLSGSTTLGNSPWSVKAISDANAQAAFSTSRASAQAAHDAAMLDAVEDWQLSSRDSLTDLLFAEGQSRETFSVATANVYADWENGVGNLLGDKPEGTEWTKDGSVGQQNGPGSTGSPRGYTGGFAGDFIGGFAPAPVPPAGRGTGGRGSMLPPRPETNGAVDQSYRPMSGEDLLLHPNTVAFLRKHPEFAKAFIEREGFGNLRRLNTVLSYGWTANLDDWFLGRDRYYASTSNLEMWIDTDMSIEDQTNALVELVDDIYSKKKIPLDTHGKTTLGDHPGFADPSKPRTQAYIQAVYGSTEFGRDVGLSIALEAGGIPFVLLSKGDDASRILSKLDDAAPVKITSPSTKLQQWAQQGGYVDPRTNKWIKFDGNLAADHVYPKDLIKKLDGFDKLSPQQQEFLLNYPGNFEPLPKSWNSSKLNRLADDWAKTPMGRQAAKEYIDALRERQQAFEGFAKNLIEFWNR